MKRLLSDRSGTSAVEYAFVASLISIAIIGALILLAASVNDSYSTTANKVAAASGNR